MHADERGALEDRLYRLIPLTQALGVKVKDYRTGQLTLSAPLGPNHNHQDTVFGGSLYAVAVTAAWSTLQFWLDERSVSASTLIQSGNMDYLLPVETDFEAQCTLPGVEDLDRLLKTLSRHHRARLPLTVEVRVDRQLVATFGGRFVVVES